ncbi:hypothetical protein EVAR_75858_1 [Eumeta japonica]|uniref:Uncharacterized protein n=1 Tax=Eumeta variegata TaxID=151549 RepID=A0A4C1TG78_EUMVA|nr:hypothetical protein EVAR_75858_1 [Eumeta japonica]
MHILFEGTKATLKKLWIFKIKIGDNRGPAFIFCRFFSVGRTMLSDVSRRKPQQQGYFNLAGDATREGAPPPPPHGSLNRKATAGSAKEQTPPPQSCATWTMSMPRPAHEPLVPFY